MGRMVGIAVICRMAKTRLDLVIASVHASIRRQATDERDRKFTAALFAARIDEELVKPLPDSTQCELAPSWMKQIEQDLDR
jgi:hypothetical protein